MVNSSILNSFKKGEDHHENNMVFRVFGMRPSGNSECDFIRNVSFKEKVIRSFKMQRNDMPRKVIPGEPLVRKIIGNVWFDMPYPKPIIKSTAHFCSPISCEYVRTEAV